MTSRNVNYRLFTSTGVLDASANKNSFEKADESGALDDKGAPKMQTIVFWKIPFEYAVPLLDPEGKQLFGPSGEPLVNISGLYIEGCEVVCRGGIQTQRKGQKDVHSMYWSYDTNNKDCKDFCGRDFDLKQMVQELFAKNKLKDPASIAEAEKKLSCMEKVQLAACQLIMATSKEHGLKGELWEIIRSVSRPITWKKAEDADGNPISGKQPQHYANLVCNGRGYGATKTIFTLPSLDPKTAEVLDWDPNPDKPSVMRGVKVTMIPVWHVTHVTVLATGKASVHMELASAVVTNIEKLVIESTQGDTMAKLASDSGLVSKLQDQISQLKLQLFGEQSRGGGAASSADHSHGGAASSADHSHGGGAASSSGTFDITPLPSRAIEDGATAKEEIRTLPKFPGLTSMLTSGPTMTQVKPTFTIHGSA